MTRDEILAKALRHYGIKHQMVKTLEELAELSQAIAKLWAEEGDVTNVAEEIADVRIMTDQVAMALQLEDAVHRVEAEKLVRLKRRIEND